MSYRFYKVKVLVVEDNEPMLEITKSLLTTFGIGNVYGAKNGQAGFELYKKTNPDIVIADWMMKPVDGISLTSKIRNDPSSPNKYVPIILMTGFSEKRRVIQARDAGVTEFLVKPFNAQDLYKRIVQIIERPRQFVRAADFFGPDRRRRKQIDADYSGPFRRENDPHDKHVTQALQQREQAQREEQAHKTLKDIREQAGLEKGDKFEINPDDIILQDSEVDE